ncbi:uncharacterized protein BT62DRAFT_1002733 [Guyanagaster necrorhizus]|uniref:Transmembrane protein n=1 Tax=Guyanagaster necrorhizus TaxID=856835 RepID=A0A9P7VX54_9AGAR|nr:uncharacterized protein BT62DRAFT_1002733 [Guyanagaster necrorhizus MCA 3950]KAG7449161.1 hypothetical protein BT62DRAFT_1002733 [Guyanagaster necrorhizus MCA 3950]
MGVVNPIVQDVSKHPDHRQVATFFLGWVFITAINNMATSTFLQNVAARIFSRSHRSSQKDNPEIDDASGLLFNLTSDCPVLLFLLSLFFMSASIACFTSLLSFHSETGALCSFVAAWGGLSVLFARVVALFLLLFALRRLGIKRLETFIYLVWILCGLGLDFVNYAVGTGTLTEDDHLEIFLCYRKHVLPTSLAASSVFSLLEIYVVGRTLVLTHSQRRREWLQIVQACSLMVFDLLTIVPSAIFIGVLGEFIPFSVGSVLILGKSLYLSTETSSAFDSVTPSSEFSEDLPFEKHDDRQMIPMPPRMSRFPLGPITRPLSPIASLPMHPYSAQCLDDPRMVGERWLNGYDTVRSSRSVDTRTARSIDEAVFQVAQRSRPLPIYCEAKGSPLSGPQTSSISSSSRFMGLSMDNHIAPLARPRLIVVPSNMSVDLDVKPDTPVSGMRDSVAYDPLLKSRFSVSTASMSLVTTSSLLLSSDIRRHLTGSSVGSNGSESVKAPSMLERSMQFQGAGHLNITQSRRSMLSNESRTCFNSSPQALPWPEKETRPGV